MLVQKFVFELVLANNDASSFHICHIDYGLRTGNITKCASPDCAAFVWTWQLRVMDGRWHSAIVRAALPRRHGMWRNAP
jgi:hypothetical protein